MEKNVWLYFNTASDTSVTFGGGGSLATMVMLPANRLIGMKPYSDSILSLSFESMRNIDSQKTDKVDLNLGANNTHLDVAKTLGRQINNTSPSFNGFICVADDSPGSDGLHVDKYITTRRETPGYIDSCGDITIWQTSGGSLVTPNPYGTGSAVIQQGGTYLVLDTGNADHIITLPKAIIGTEIWLIPTGTTGYEIRTSDPETIGINGNSGLAVGAESAVTGSMELVHLICHKTTSWIGHWYAADGSNFADRLGHLPESAA